MVHLRVFALLTAASCIIVTNAKRVKDEEAGGTSSMPYTVLANARARATSDKSVKVKFGGALIRTAQLTRNGVDETAFSGIQWRQPDSSGLSRGDKKYIDDYTGRFDYSRNVGVVLRGLTPYTTAEDQANKFGSRDHASLTEEVLAWTVGFANALNKLPDLAQPRPLWRGAWETSGQLKRMQTLPQAYSVPWFQPMSSDESYAPKFLTEKYQPASCQSKKGGCIGSGSQFPVLYEFTTTVGKDLREWNLAESEFMLLPNTAVKIKSVTKIINDKFMDMDNNALVAWLSRGDHRSVDPNDETLLGPFDELAAAVRKQGWDGKRFIETNMAGYVTGPKGKYDYHEKYLVDLGIDDEKYDNAKKSQLTVALRNRFKLPPLKAERYGGFVSNSVLFFYKIVGETD